MNNRYEAFTILILRINRSIQNIKQHEMKEYGLKGIHATILFLLLNKEEGLSVSLLSKITKDDKGAISKAVAKLNELNYVLIKSPKYNGKITLTDKGKEIAYSVEKKISKAVDEGGFGLDDDKRALLYEMLTLICENLEKYDQELESK